MTPHRQVNINGYTIEEFWWAGKFVVYVNNVLRQKTFEQACEEARAAK